MMRALRAGGMAIHRRLQAPPNAPAAARWAWGFVRFVLYWLWTPVLALSIVMFAGAAAGFWKMNSTHSNRNATACVNQLTGSVPQLERAVRDTLRDPASFAHVESAGTEPDANGDIAVRMTYRARNGFGGMNVETAHAVVHTDCSVTLNAGPLSLAKPAAPKPIRLPNASDIAAFRNALAASQAATLSLTAAPRCSGQTYAAAKAAFDKLVAAYIPVANLFDDPTDELMILFHTNALDLADAYREAHCRADAEKNYREMDGIRTIQTEQVQALVRRSDEGLRLLDR